MRYRSCRAGILGFILIAATADQSLFAQVQPADSGPSFRQLLEKAASFSPNLCGPPDEATPDPADSALDLAAELVQENLNRNADRPALQRATETLKTLQRVSGEVLAKWFEGERFRFTVLDLLPILVVKIGLRSHETFFVFGLEGGPRNAWRRISSIEGAKSGPNTSLELYPLQRGPSRRPRFLARFATSGCIGAPYLSYSAYEWRGDVGDIVRIIGQAGAWGYPDEVPDFMEKLRTEGPAISLPYCWFSPVDVGNRPSLCGVDTYDVSGDKVKFRDHQYLQPDLAALAKAIEHAEQRDYPAVLGYCANSQVARKLVSEIPPGFVAIDIQMTHTAPGKEDVEFGFEHNYRFDLEDRDGRWLIVGFSSK